VKTSSPALKAALITYLGPLQKREPHRFLAGRLWVKPKRASAPCGYRALGNLGERTGNFLLAELSNEKKQLGDPDRLHSLASSLRYRPAIRPLMDLFPTKAEGRSCIVASAHLGQNFAEKDRLVDRWWRASRGVAGGEERGRKRRALRTEIKAARTSLARLIGQGSFLVSSGRKIQKLDRLPERSCYFGFLSEFGSSPDRSFSRGSHGPNRAVVLRQLGKAASSSSRRTFGPIAHKGQPPSCRSPFAPWRALLRCARAHSESGSSRCHVYLRGKRSFHREFANPARCYK